MKVLGICGSPRKGNTEWMLDTILKSFAVKGAETEIILLRKKNIKTCKGCLVCETGGLDRRGECVIKDDMQEIFPRILDADCLVIGTPVYFEMLSGILKNFIDRTCPIWTKMTGKTVLGVAVAEEGIGDAINNLKTYCSVCKMTWGGSVTSLAKNPGDLEKDNKTRQKLQRLVHRTFTSLQS